MQVLIFCCACVMAFGGFVSVPVRAAEVHPSLHPLWPKTAQWIEFSTQVHHSQQHIRIARVGDKWICETDIRPYFVARSNPLEAFDNLKVQKFRNCESQQTKIIDNRLGKKIQADICWDDPKARRVLLNLRKACTPPAI